MPASDPYSLYRRWEAQHWSTQALDLSIDAAHWELLPDARRAALRQTMTVFFVGEQGVTDALGPILAAAPNEDERIFLATQAADEARHAMFFRRFFEEVLKAPGGAAAARADLDGPGASGFRTIFDEHLADAVEALGRQPWNRTRWTEAVVTYHLVIEGYLALAGLRNMLHFLRSESSMPGLTAGLTAVARDESRHVGYGVLALRRRVREDPALAKVIARKLVVLAEPAVRTLVNPDNLLGLSDRLDRSHDRAGGGDELRELALNSLARRAAAIGLSEASVADVQASYRKSLKAVLSGLRGRTARAGAVSR
jgi:ribonucleoside-diphosphate reductase beta chain